jgi:hypothetical protein
MIELPQIHVNDGCPPSDMLYPYEYVEQHGKACAAAAARETISGVERLLVLLEHAVKEADGWHDENRGCPIEGDPLIDEARMVLAINAARTVPDPGASTSLDL